MTGYSMPLVVRACLRPLLMALLLPLLLAGLSIQPVRAAAIIVNSVADTYDNPGCATSGTGTCSLRDGIAYANTHAGTVVALNPGTYTLTIAPVAPDDVSTGNLNLTANMTIQGTDPATTIIDGGGPTGIRDGIFRTSGTGTTVTFSGLTLQRGQAPAGGALLAFGSGAVTITNCRLLNNSALGAGGAMPSAAGDTAVGGAISMFGPLTIINSTFDHNSAIGGQGADGMIGTGGAGGDGGFAQGGAIYPNAIAGATVLLVRGSTFTFNTARGGAGGTGGASIGIGQRGGRSGQGSGGVLGSNALGPGSTITFQDSTFANNSAMGGTGGTGGESSGPGGNALGGSGGAINSSSLTVTGSTFVNNSAVGGVGGTAGADTAGFGGGNGGDGGRGQGAAIQFFDGSVANSTFTGNQATGGKGGDPTPGASGPGRGGNGGIGDGGATSTGGFGTPTIVNATIIANVVTGGAPGSDLGIGTGSPGSAISSALFTGGGPLTVTNTILANNTGASACATPVTGLHNLEFPGPASCGAGSTVGDPRPGSLASNGGPTQTIALGAGSAALDTGDDAACAAAPVNNVDQRGVPRPQGAHCDIGAYEVGLPISATALIAAPNPSTAGQAVTFTAAVTTPAVGFPTISGTVTFQEGGTTLGTGTVNSSGVATFATSGLMVGSHIITASYGGDAAHSGSTSPAVTQVVSAAPLTSIAVTAASAAIPVGGTDQFTATCAFADGSTASCTASVTWSSDTPAVATISATGLATGVSAGTAKITASLSGITSNAVTLTVTGGGPPPAGGLQFYPLTKPVRLLDTRAGSTAFVHPNASLSAGQTLSLPGQFSYQGVTIPATAQAIVGNATVANGSNGTPPGFATIFPSGVPLPLTSNLNFVPGTVRPNDFTVALGSDTKFNLYSSSGGDFVVDISGYYAPVGAGGLYFHPLAAPVRELDTRAGATAFVHPNAPLTAGQTLTLPGSFTANSIAIPSSAKALVGNATVANGSNGTPAGFATLFPDDVPLPLASNLNFVPGTVAPNAFTVALGGGDGGYNLYSSTGGDFVVDITGYLDTTAAGGLLFTPLSAPVRELDTRAGATAFVHPSATLTAGQTLTLPGAFTYNSITIPASAKALVGNATVANDGNGTPAGFATLYPDGVPLPLASNLNFVPKQVAPNAITVGIGSDGKYALYSSSGGDFIIDITGFFS